MVLSRQPRACDLYDISGRNGRYKSADQEGGPGVRTPPPPSPEIYQRWSIV